MVTYPKDWKEYAISDITSTVISGGTPSTARQEYYGGNVPWLSSTEIHQKRIKTPTTYITVLGLQNSSAKIAPEMSVLIALAGQGKTRGTAAYLMQPMALNQSLAALVTNEKSDPEFLYYLIESMYLPLRDLSSGDGGRGGLNKKLIKGVFVTIPIDVAEQKAIARTLSEFDAYIDNLTELIEKKRAIRDGALEDLISRKTRLAGFCGKWTEARLSDIGTFIKGAPLSKADISTSGTPLILYGELYTTYHEIANKIHRYTRQVVDEKYYSQVGDVVLPTSGETAEEIATATCVMVEGVILGGDLNIYRTDVVDGRFLSYVINHVVNNEISAIAQGASVVHVNAKSLGKIAVRYPDIAEQEAIADALTAMDEEIEALESEKEKMIQIREGAMDDLLTGRIRLKV